MNRKKQINTQQFKNVYMIKFIKHLSTEHMQTTVYTRQVD